MVQFRILRGSQQDHNPGLQESGLRILVQSPSEAGPGETGPEELVDFQGSLALNLRTVHPSEQGMKQRQQEACVDECRAPENKQTNKNSDLKKEEYKRE